eukprot:6490112-Amphidinium_carterae.1
MARSARKNLKTFRISSRCGVGYYTYTQERAFFPLPGIKQSVYRAELHAVACAFEECQPHEVVSDCKGVLKAVQALQTGRRQPKGRNRDLKQRVLNALLPGQRISWIKAHLKQADVDIGRITTDDLHGNDQADLLANEGTAAHGDFDSEGAWLRLADFANNVFHFGVWLDLVFVIDQMKNPESNCQGNRQKKNLSAWIVPDMLEKSRESTTLPT